ncbi:TPA_asm: hypothetical protein G1R43_11370 [Salmonella enterica subsp. enterica serovar Typhimurium]|uniref:Uncharacterized protein n=3 Tax=Salmonella enterica I TaxID=59201 RepID=A0A5W5ZUY0_SALTM|nr:hypothetical protein CHD15_14970 [Salmonella enterica]EAA5093936.1 hypothetical protein [Salmonella enterica subsp. enterica serovar Bovismorbificans]EAA7255172.1 hypothetical protein [Salmonella enterica subsp. enterica serovar Newport]EBU6838351.1 hypothetical protein [Salmonella enterica subsp. enterica serovar Typhimurium]EBU8924451.1 hypothetical protein [Salmonella enterica subsp. enterica serovar Nima]EBW8769680.1 hypothetical protein [Salmonella enterica subsp. enterica serovar Read
MKIPTNLIPGFYESTRPVVLFRNKDGTFKSGFVLRGDEFVVNISLLRDGYNFAGLSVAGHPKRS